LLVTVGISNTVGFSNNLLYNIFQVIIYLIGNFIGFWLIYIAFRESSEEPEKTRPKKKVIVKESVFRITKRPDNITEEEVTFHRERKICLVCKGKARRFTFICPECDALYCENCARKLSNLENACWVCNTPFDESKPSKPFETEEKEEIEVPEKIQEK